MLQSPGFQKGDHPSGAPAAGPLNSGAMNWLLSSDATSTPVLVATALVYPVFDAVTFTASVVPASATATTYVLLLAPPIGVPLRSHW